MTGNPRRAVVVVALATLLAVVASRRTAYGRQDGPVPGVRLETTRLCPIVPARDVAAAAFPPAEPVRAFGTDLGFSYEVNGKIVVLFGDTWQRIDICPLQTNDDSLATMEIPAEDWPGFTTRTVLDPPDCPELDFALDEEGTSFAPIELRRWDGEPIPLGPLQTPLAGFHDGEKEWAVFIVSGGQRCSEEQARSGASCPTELSPQAADLTCGFVAERPLCLDTTSTKRGDGRRAYTLHIAERTGRTSYVSRFAFLTNKYLNLAARAVRAFDPSGGRDDRTGAGALLMWGRPGFDERNRDGEAPPYFMFHPLPFERSGERIVFRPRYLSAWDGEGPTFGSSQADAVPLYDGELEPVNQTAVSFVEPLARWLMIYGGMSVDFVDADGSAGRSQPVRGALYARLAPDPWGPWSEPMVVLTEEQMAEDMVCGKRAPEGCLPSPAPMIRPACIERVDPHGGGALYGAAIIDSLTREAEASTGEGRAADVFWLVSTWHPYAVVLVKTRIELDRGGFVEPAAPLGD